ncbi:helix-turn-helix transcriptional regulator [Desulfogranum marinum]|uniref:helix-turn-helix transcriptional regulator n=1 Tax=Desulfogranum marinum TaxID=453220 RepID=UPI0019662339|nr:AlpA family phage regulatory protein [Desulfogranum marinum]MBM9514372.1 AlpA family transcriptional regulator [Desulfogranum marinum]
MTSIEQPTGPKSKGKKSYNIQNIPGITRTVLRIHQVESATGWGKSKIYELMKTGAFPTPVKLGPKSVGWWSDEIQEWIDSLPRVAA